MVDVDISHIWSGITLPELLAIEKDISAAHEKLAEQMEDWPVIREDAPELEHILTVAERIRTTTQVCVIVAASEACSGIRAAMELLPCSEGAPEILFAGDTLSLSQWNGLTKALEGRDYSLIAISPRGTTLESAIAFRGLRWALERRLGTEEASQRIYTVTVEESPLWQLAQQRNWESFSIPEVGGFDVLSAAGLLPLAVAGLDIAALLRGGEKARKCCDLRSFENPLWLYTGVRNALYHKGYHTEVFGGFGPELWALGIWWQQLFSQAEGKQGKGPFPVPAVYPQDLHTIGHRLRAGERHIFETMVNFEKQDGEYTVVSDVSDLEGVNHLAGKSLEQVRQYAYAEVLASHDDAGIPVITMELGNPEAESLGELLVFLILASMLSGCMLGVEQSKQEIRK